MMPGVGFRADPATMTVSAIKSRDGRSVKSPGTRIKGVCDGRSTPIRSRRMCPASSGLSLNSSFAESCQVEGMTRMLSDIAVATAEPVEVKRTRELEVRLEQRQRVLSGKAAERELVDIDQVRRMPDAFERQQNTAWSGECPGRGSPRKHTGMSSKVADPSGHGTISFRSASADAPSSV
jgi:hypothetical protein